MKDSKICEVGMEALSPLLEEVVRTGGTVEITVTGNSMLPMLRNRKSRVRLSAADAVQIGDVPLYRRENGAYILHRIVGTENGKYICCGDHQWKLEKGIGHDQIVAVMTHFSKGNRWVSCRNPLYRCYWKIWLWLRPVRHCIDSVRRRIRRFFGKK